MFKLVTIEDSAFNMTENEEDVSQCQVDPDDDDSTFELIRKVESRPFIYNCRDPRHSKRDALADAWNEIASGLIVKGKAVTGAFCKRKWKTLRDYYYKIKRVQAGKSGDGAKDKKPWAYFSAMDRVLSAFKEENESTQSNFPGDDSDANENLTFLPQTSADTSIADADEIENGPVENLESSPLTTAPPKRARKRKQEEEEQWLNEKIMKVLEEPEEVKDQFYHFGMTICNKLRNVPIETAEYAMLRISTLLYEIVYKSPVVPEQPIPTTESTQ